MTGLFGALAAVALLMWLFGGRRDRRPAPEDDVMTDLDRAELEAAERELREDQDPRSFDQPDERDDWGPGAP